MNKLLQAMILYYMIFLFFYIISSLKQNKQLKNISIYQKIFSDACKLFNGLAFRVWSQKIKSDKRNNPIQKNVIKKVNQLLEQNKAKNHISNQSNVTTDFFSYILDYMFYLKQLKVYQQLQFQFNQHNASYFFQYFNYYYLYIMDQPQIDQIDKPNYTQLQKKNSFKLTFGESESQESDFDLYDQDYQSLVRSTQCLQNGIKNIIQKNKIFNQKRLKQMTQQGQRPKIKPVQNQQIIPQELKSIPQQSIDQKINPLQNNNQQNIIQQKKLQPQKNQQKDQKDQEENQQENQILLTPPSDQSYDSGQNYQQDYAVDNHQKQILKDKQNYIRDPERYLKVIPDFINNCAIENIYKYKAIYYPYKNKIKQFIKSQQKNQFFKNLRNKQKQIIIPSNLLNFLNKYKLRLIKQNSQSINKIQKLWQFVPDKNKIFYQQTIKPLFKEYNDEHQSGLYFLIGERQNKLFNQNKIRELLIESNIRSIFDFQRIKKYLIDKFKLGKTLRRFRIQQKNMSNMQKQQLNLKEISLIFTQIQKSFDKIQQYYSAFHQYVYDPDPSEIKVLQNGQKKHSGKRIWIDQTDKYRPKIEQIKKYLKDGLLFLLFTKGNVYIQKARYKIDDYIYQKVIDEIRDYYLKKKTQRSSLKLSQQCSICQPNFRTEQQRDQNYKYNQKVLQRLFDQTFKSSNPKYLQIIQEVTNQILLLEEIDQQKYQEKVLQILKIKFDLMEAQENYLKPYLTQLFENLSFVNYKKERIKYYQTKTQITEGDNQKKIQIITKQIKQSKQQLKKIIIPAIWITLQLLRVNTPIVKILKQQITNMFSKKSRHFQMPNLSFKDTLDFQFFINYRIMRRILRILTKHYSFFPEQKKQGEKKNIVYSEKILHTNIFNSENFQKINPGTSQAFFQWEVSSGQKLNVHLRQSVKINNKPFWQYESYDNFEKQKQWLNMKTNQTFISLKNNWKQSKGRDLSIDFPFHKYLIWMIQPIRNLGVFLINKMHQQNVSSRQLKKFSGIHSIQNNRMYSPSFVGYQACHEYINSQINRLYSSNQKQSYNIISKHKQLDIRDKNFSALSTSQFYKMEKIINQEDRTIRQWLQQKKKISDLNEPFFYQYIAKLFDQENEQNKKKRKDILKQIQKFAIKFLLNLNFEEQVDKVNHKRDDQEQHLEGQHNQDINLKKKPKTD